MSEEKKLSRRTAIAAGAAGLAMAAAGTAIAQEARGDDARAKEVAARDTERKWRHAGPFPTAEAAANFLNVSPAQGPGEASLACCGDGQFQLIWYL
jgi:hypothetical protein